MTFFRLEGADWANPIKFHFNILSDLCGIPSPIESEFPRVVIAIDIITLRVRIIPRRIIIYNPYLYPTNFPYYEAIYILFSFDLLF